MFHLIFVRDYFVVCKVVVYVFLGSVLLLLLFFVTLYVCVSCRAQMMRKGLEKVAVDTF